MPVSRSLGVVPAVLALAAFAPAARAQTTDQTLQEAIRRYQALDIEGARSRFSQVLSPASPFPVTESQRATAQLYLGATLVTSGQRDSAITFYFAAALQRNPLIDMDPRQFSDDERSAFAEARRRVFRIGLRTIPRDTIEPRSRVNFTVVTTHQGTVRIELVNTLTDDRYPLFADVVDGARDVPFAGLHPRPTEREPFIPQGTYDLVITGESQAGGAMAGRMDSISVLVELVHIRDTLLDTLQSLTDDQLRLERQPPSAAVRDLLNGFGIGAAALTSSVLIGRSNLEEGRALSAAMALIGVGAGVYAYTKRRGNPVIPENIEWNNQQRRLRAQLNERIMQGNRERIAQTRLVLRPLAQ